MRKIKDAEAGEADEFNDYCTRWVEVRNLKVSDYIAVPIIESDLNNGEIQNLEECKGRVAQRIEPLYDSGEDAGSITVRKSRRAHTDLFRNNKIEKEEKQACSLDKEPLRLRGISHEFFFDSEITESHTLMCNRDNKYINISVLEQSDITWDKIASIKTLEPQHVYDLSIEGTRNFIANDIVAHNTFLATNSGSKVGVGKINPATELDVAGGINSSTLNVSGNTFLATQSGNVGIGDTTPSDALEVIGNARVSGSLNATSINATFFKQGTKDVASVGDFNLGNISNNTLKLSYNLTSSNVLHQNINVSQNVTLQMNQSTVYGNNTCRIYSNNTCLISECGTSGTPIRSMICI